MNSPLSADNFVLPARTPHWSYDPSRAHAPSLTSPERRMLAMQLRRKRAVLVAVGTALWTAATGERPTLKPIKSVTRTAAKAAEIDLSFLSV